MLLKDFITDTKDFPDDTEVLVSCHSKEYSLKQPLGVFDKCDAFLDTYSVIVEPVWVHVKEFQTAKISKFREMYQDKPLAEIESTQDTSSFSYPVSDFITIENTLVIIL